MSYNFAEVMLPVNLRLGLSPENGLPTTSQQGRQLALLRALSSQGPLSVLSSSLPGRCLGTDWALAQGASGPCHRQRAGPSVLSRVLGRWGGLYRSCQKMTIHTTSQACAVSVSPPVLAHTLQWRG